jgi:hypothetical protein
MFRAQGLQFMRVLIACEFSGRVRDAFIARGHFAWSCDLQPCEADNLYHYQCDVREVLNDNWDLIIAFPPCDYLCNAGARWWKDRPLSQRDSMNFFMMFVHRYDAETAIAIENPIGIMSSMYRPPDQIIHPWQHGHPAKKATCLWLHGTVSVPLPLIQPSNIVAGRHKDSHSRSPSKTRKQDRSRIYKGFANAFAEQWG